ncbi:Malate/L-lactate dehydrogenase [Popillia japonica]|uniref:Malate/L-lactate dehydrogenase n=1 Tax=Popillia japonica TaxID=7064 RepID=A0AAW1HT01_POPJA
MQSYCNNHYLTYYSMMGVSIIRNIISLTPRLQHIVITGRRNMSLAQIDTPIIPLVEAKRFISECLQAVGTPRKHADAMGDLLAEADYRGHYSHGMNRLEMYIQDVRSGSCDGKAVPKILKETAATAWVDGQNGLGAVIGNFCMDLAIKKAKEVGIGWVSVKGSNHFGIAGKYTLEAVKEGMLGMSFTNTSPFMAPTRGKQAMLGTNPLSLAAPGKEGDNFVLDMATTAVAVGKIEIARRKGAPIPDGWAQDKEGHITTDTTEALARGSCLMPLGGSETNSGYKGYGLGFLVEIFCGILGGATYGPNVRKWGTTDRTANLGQCFVAINPQCFAPGTVPTLGNGVLRIGPLIWGNASSPLIRNVSRRASKGD